MRTGEERHRRSRRASRIASRSRRASRSSGSFRTVERHADGGRFLGHADAIMDAMGWADLAPSLQRRWRWCLDEVCRGCVAGFAALDRVALAATATTLFSLLKCRGCVRGMLTARSGWEGSEVAAMCDRMRGSGARDKQRRGSRFRPGRSTRRLHSKAAARRRSLPRGG